MTDKWTLITGDRDTVTIDVALDYDRTIDPDGAGGADPVPNPGPIIRTKITIASLNATTLAQGRTALHAHAVRVAAEWRAANTVPAWMTSAIGYTEDI